MKELRLYFNNSSESLLDEIIVDANISAEFVNIQISNIYEVAELFRTSTQSDWIELMIQLDRFNYNEFRERIRYGCSVLNCDQPPEREVGKLYFDILEQLTTRKIS